MGNIINDNWFVGGDFNMIMKSMERKGGGKVEQSLINRFTCFIANVGLYDLGYSDSPYTWRRGFLYMRLDRFLANSSFINHFHIIKVQHLSPVTSDHNPLLLTLAFTVFGNVHTKVKEAQHYVDTLEAQLETNPQLLDNVVQAHIALLDAITVEENLVKQKANDSSFVVGDRNTKYFHATLKHRRNINNILKIRKGDGSILTNAGEIGDSAVTYFSELFQSSTQTMSVNSSYFVDEYDYIKDLSLSYPPDEHEILNAFKSICPNKALGPVGLSSAFYI
ncbi:uncharacterized protein LOC110037187 [Phalaenopsis equestris]|uniref:uncharacterized protein LOC110037187 n=1 Tax=Phalaenopsis equestris TaxID=78828 RepID=UPI0009E266BD|nr:uncharacterized protein LOC110037187 [Phalaenopsis equestris]